MFSSHHPFHECASIQRLEPLVCCRKHVACNMQFMNSLHPMPTSSTCWVLSNTSCSATSFHQTFDQRNLALSMCLGSPLLNGKVSGAVSEVEGVHQPVSFSYCPAVTVAEMLKSCPFGPMFLHPCIGTEVVRRFQTCFGHIHFP